VRCGFGRFYVGGLQTYQPHAAVNAKLGVDLRRINVNCFVAQTERLGDFLPSPIRPAEEIENLPFPGSQAASCKRSERFATRFRGTQSIWHISKFTLGELEVNTFGFQNTNKMAGKSTISNMRTLLLLTLLANVAPAKPAPKVVLTIVANQGDGTICTATKIFGSTINLSLTCTNPAGSASASLKATGSSVTSMQWGFGDVSCLLLVNPTAQPITQGSFAAIPPAAVGWQCSTNIRAGGVVSGQAPIVIGTGYW
jgi:hypothetical protein